MKYKELVKSNFTRLKNDDDAMWASIESVSELMEEIREQHPDIYRRFMREQHEIMCGKHYNQAYAEWEVSQMYHKNADGTVSRGEHWTLEDTNDVLSKHRGKVPSAYNEYDFYVALNAHWHDVWRLASTRLASEEEAIAYVIDEAICVWFNDDDWVGEDKVWTYFRAKNE